MPRLKGALHYWALTFHLYTTPFGGDSGGISKGEFKEFMNAVKSKKMYNLLNVKDLEKVLKELKWAATITVNLFALQGYTDKFTSYKKYEGYSVSVSGSYEHIFGSVNASEASFSLGFGVSTSPVSVGVGITEMKFRKKWTKKLRKWGIKIRKDLKDLVDEYVGYHVHYGENSARG